MTRPGFEKIQYSAKRLFGPRKVLLCGFGAVAQDKFKELLGRLGIADLPLISVSHVQSGQTLHDLAELPDGSGADRPSSLPRAIIVGGISENELHQLMTACRNAGMKQALWAALTPVSIQWPLLQLLTELAAERKALCAKSNDKE